MDKSRPTPKSHYGTRWNKAASALRGPARRYHQAQVVKALGRGAQRFAERALGLNRQTIRKGLEELEKGQPGRNHYEACGRKRAEEHLPELLADIEQIVAPGCQTDPTFRTTRLYTP